MSEDTTTIERRYRTEDQIKHGQSRVAELALQGYGPTHIHRILESEGHDLTLRQVQYDLKKVRDHWIERQQESYDELIATELFRLDMVERELWEALRASTKGKVRTTVEKLMRKAWGDEEGEDVVVNDEEMQMMINKITETTEVSEAPDHRFFSQIIEVQKERRKLLGLYAPKQLNIFQEDIKTYQIVSPADWPKATPPKVIDG